MIERRRTRGLVRPTAADGARGGQIMVIGLGRFGSALAQELVEAGFEVLGVDGSARRVQEHADVLTHVVEADTTDQAALRQLGIADFATVVVGIGSDVEASILTTSALVDLGVANIWAKAVSDAHGRILERVGAHHVVFPEHDMGRRVAHLVTERVLDWFQLDAGFAMVETVVPHELEGLTLAEAGIRAKYGVTVVCVKPAGGSFTYATPDTVLGQGDLLVVAGASGDAESFAHLTSNASS
jgi:trk system potassium uptake protein TrkA